MPSLRLLGIAAGLFNERRISDSRFLERSASICGALGRRNNRAGNAGMLARRDLPGPAVLMASELARRGVAPAGVRSSSADARGGRVFPSCRPDSRGIRSSRSSTPNCGRLLRREI